MLNPQNKSPQDIIPKYKTGVGFEEVSVSVFVVKHIKTAGPIHKQQIYACSKSIQIIIQFIIEITISITS